MTLGLKVSSDATWDQIPANEKLFGIMTNFNEDLYTTKLDSTTAGSKDGESMTQRLKIVNDIIGVSRLIIGL